MIKGQISAALTLLVLSSMLLGWSRVFAAGASLELNPDKTEIITGGQFWVALNVSPAGQKLIGVDAIIKFDPQVLRVVQVADNDLIPGDSIKVIDNSAGILKLGFSNSYGKFLTKSGRLAWIVIEARKPANKTLINFDFTQGKTTDSNLVVSGGKDVLLNTIGARLKIIQEPIGKKLPEEKVKPKVLSEAIVLSEVTSSRNGAFWWQWIIFGLGVILIGGGLWQFRRARKK